MIRDFNCSEFIFCSDAGLGSKGNRFFNSFGNRSYVITYSLKKMKKEERELALLPTQFKVPGSDKWGYGCFWLYKVSKMGLYHAEK